MMDLLKKDSVDLLRKMVAVPSVSFEEEKVADLISSALESYGIEPVMVGRNVIARNKSYAEGKKTLVLDAHIDTVPAAASYTRDPFDAGADPDRVWGLGSNDDGASVVSMIAAFRYFYSKEDLPINIVLALSCEEERSGPDGARLLYSADGPAETRLSGWGLIGEPTGMKAATSERGLLVLDGEAKGVSGHAARNEGVNALYIALEDIETLRNFDFDRVSPKMGRVKLTVTQINAGTAHNVVPDLCTFVVDIRPTEKYTNAEIVAMPQKEANPTLNPRNLKNCSSATYEGSPLLAAVERLGIGTFSSPTTSNWMRTGRDAIKMGPGESSRSHHADEYILVSEIGEAIEKYIEFIETFYGNSLE
ncbi:MAG: M20/M25/M40 family metallo-hydrolase [Bacteroidales bacterium]|nr:M20/M25/M40 family metallo-hydrolase [Bacteroidales bacterium]